MVLLEGFCGREVTFSDGKLSSKDASIAAVKASISTPKSISFTGLELTLNVSDVEADMGTFFDDSVADDDPDFPSSPFFIVADSPSSN